MQNNSNPKNNQQSSLLESLRNMGGFGEMPKDFRRQLLGEQKKKFSGEINKEGVNMPEVFSGSREENQKLRERLKNENRLRAEQEVLVERRTAELRTEISTIHEKAEKIVTTVSEMDEEIKVAVMREPVDVDAYGLNFVRYLLDRVQDFLTDVKESRMWLQTFNKRSTKRRGMKSRLQDGSFLSSEDFVTRNVG